MLVKQLLMFEVAPPVTPPWFACLQLEPKFALPPVPGIFSTLSSFFFRWRTLQLDPISFTSKIGLTPFKFPPPNALNFPLFVALDELRIIQKSRAVLFWGFVSPTFRSSDRVNQHLPCLVFALGPSSSDCTYFFHLQGFRFLSPHFSELVYTPSA